MSGSGKHDDQHYERLRRVAPGVGVLLQRNPGPMTLEGTNTWLLRAPGASVSVVVDPGQDDGEQGRHLEALLQAAGDVALVIVTHGHFDHGQAAPALHARTGAPVYAADPAACLGDSVPLTDGLVLDAGGLQVQVLATPGHTADSVSLRLDSGAVLTGDSILGRGTTVVAHPDGNLADYLATLQRLRDLGDVPVLPGHGPELASLREVSEAYLRHRGERLDQVRAALETLETLGTQASARAVVELVYAEVDPAVWWAAELSVQAQLDYLRA